MVEIERVANLVKKNVVFDLVVRTETATNMLAEIEIAINLWEIEVAANLLKSKMTVNFLIDTETATSVSLMEMEIIPKQLLVC